MIGYRCTNCEHKSITKSIFCPKCRSKEIESFAAPTEGTVYSFTTIHIAPPEFVDLAPYHVALVELTEGLKVTAFLQDEVEIGDSVRFVEEKDQAFIFALND